MKKPYLSIGTVIVTAVLTLFASMSTLAEDEKAFAEHKFVLQISDMDAAKQTLVLNVAANIMKHYGPDKADVEIVAFGPGLRLLFEENVNGNRIDGLVNNSGVRFAACGNTITKMTKTLGHPPAMNSHATVVPGGIIRIKELADQGYLLVRP
ncbi:MAG: hypothetical protein KBT63_10265 [Porticoccaceae bacterium]|nr:hypothetical protein [Porticoccaceae bacterium]